MKLDILKNAGLRVGFVLARQRRPTNDIEPDMEVDWWCCRYDDSFDIVREGMHCPAL